MTIELSIRQRATQARYVAMLYLGVAVVVLVSTYFSLPFVTGQTLDSINRIESFNASVGVAEAKDAALIVKQSLTLIHVFALTVLILGVAAISFSCYLLGRAAYIETESAERLRGIADALCISGDSLDKLEKAILLLVPRGKARFQTDNTSSIDLKSLVEVLKQLK